MPPRKSTTQNQTTRTNSRKRLSSPTEEALENSKNNDESTQNKTLNDDDQTNSSSNSDQVEDQTKDDAESTEGDTKAEKKPAGKPKGQKRAGSEPKGHIIRVGEEIHIPATKHENFAVVDKNVYREIVLRGSRRVSYQLVYTAGTAIPLSKLDQIQ